MPAQRRRWPAGASSTVAEAFTRRGLIAGGLALLPASAFSAPSSTEKQDLALAGHQVQGGVLIGRTRPGAEITLDGETMGETSRHGLFVMGFDRDAPGKTLLTVKRRGWSEESELAVMPGEFDIQKIDGLPQDQVTPEDPALLARIEAEAARKAKGFASNLPGEGFQNGFIMPVEATRLSGRFGGQRILNGVPNRPHYGADLAAPVGTPVHAPADGTIAFAETGLHFEGSLILIDHGQGLVSAYLHLSKVLVEKGQSVERGSLIGLVGQEGRATGPHLCWRMKWRGRNLDPTLLVGVVAPAA